MVWQVYVDNAPTSISAPSGNHHGSRAAEAKSFLGSRTISKACYRHCSHRYILSHSSMNGQRGDDLDDDFVPDELVATSGEEDNGPGDDISGLLSADEDAEEAEVYIKEKSMTEKKRKRREKEKERKIKVCVTYQIIGLSLTIIIFRRRGS